MEKKICFVYDDIEKPSRIISGIIGNKRYSEIIYKKVKFIERLKQTLEKFHNVQIRFEYLKNWTEIENLKENLLFEDKEDSEKIYIHFLSSNVVVNEEKFFIFLEKCKYINQTMVDNKYNSSIIVFPNIQSYSEYLTKRTLDNNKNQFFLDKDEILPNNFKINLSELRDFLLFFSGSFEARYFNSLSSDKYTITKSSVDKMKMKKEHDFYYMLPHHMQKWMVMPYDYKENKERASYTMERLNIPDIALQWIHNSFNEESFENYLNKIFEFIITRERRDISKEKFNKVFNELYYKKVEERIQKLKEMEIYGEIDLFIKFSTNYNSIDEIFAEYKEYYNEIFNRKFKYIEVIGHGDPCFSNTLYDKSSEMLKLIDPKGALSEDEIYTNEYYDLAKLSHSILGNYDFMNNGLFTIELNNDLKMDLKIESANLKSLQDMFIKKVKEYGYDMEVIRICEISLFLSMLPLHIDIPSKVFAFILNAINMMKELNKYGK